MNKKQKARVDPVEVYCRIRPFIEINDVEKCLNILDEANLMLQIPECSAAYRSGQTKQLVYSFTQIFDETTTQKEIFDQIGYSLVHDLLNGKNGLLFTYGVTGSGKTYTMIGNQQEPGMLQRSLDTIFSSISLQQARKYTYKPDKMNGFDIQTDGEALLERQKKELLPNLQAKTPSTHRNKAIADAEKLVESNTKLVDVNIDHVYAVFVSYIEIYNNYIYDLLDDGTNDGIKRIDNKESKCLKEDSRGSMYIKDAVEIEVKSTEEALELMHRAQKRRVVASTDLNSESSRSHSIFTMRIVQSPPYDSTAQVDFKSLIHVSQLSLVDLAGSERTKRTKNTGSRLREAGNINSSLMALRNCMEVLRENTLNGLRKMVPYRDSKVTLLFKNYFEGNGKIKMILCINPTSQEFDETINVLKFSELIKDVLVPASNDMRALKQITNVLATNIDTNELCNNLQLNCLQLNNQLMTNMQFPSVGVYNYDDAFTINNLISFLEEFNRRKEIILAESNIINQQFYIKLRELYEDNERLRIENGELKNRLDSKEKNEQRLDNKIKALEKVINTYRTPITPSQHNKENFKPSSHDNEFSEKRRNKDTDTLNQAVIGASTSNNTPINTLRTSRPVTSAHSTGRTIPPLPPLQTPSKQFVAAHAYTNHIQQLQQQQQYTTSTSRYQSPVRLTPSSSRDGIPIANKRAQRRSKSADMWLDHRPQNTIKTDTVLQPKMGRKRSVSKVELDDAKRSNKYVLTHQQQDDDGEIVTNLIKGDILQSPSGGANVIFTDVETLCVKSQEVLRTARKRGSEEMVIGDREIIEERCSTAIEGHQKSARSVKRSVK